MEDNEIALKYKEIEGQGGNCQKKQKGKVPNSI